MDGVRAVRVVERKSEQGKRRLGWMLVDIRWGRQIKSRTDGMK